MLLTQYDPGCLAHASSLIADEATGTAVVVDPQRNSAQYLHDAMQHGWHVDYIFLIHFHANLLASHDVRGSGQRADTYIAGSLHLPLNQLKRQCSTVPRDRTVQPATLTPRMDYSWYRWECLWTPPAAGTYTLMSRATNNQGETQPVEFPNTWDGHPYHTGGSYANVCRPTCL